MNLKKKMIYLVIVFTVLSMLTIGFVARSTIMKSYLSLENENAIVEYERVHNGFNFMIHRLDTILVDWAHWDDIYDYMKDENLDFVYRNVVPTTFIDSEIEYFVLLNSEGEEVLERKYDLDQGYFTHVSETILKEMGSLMNETGLIWVDGKTLVVASSDVRDSNLTKKPIGSLHFAYDLNDRILNQIREAFKANIQIYHGVESKFKESYSVVRYDTFSVISYEIPYLNDDLVLRVDVLVDNKISELGRSTIGNFIIVEAIILFAFSCMLFIFLRYIVLKRLTKLSSDVFKIINSEDLSLRLSVKGKDEISDLKDDINTMLIRIEKMNNEMTNFATYDMMTGTLNRRVGIETLETLIAVSKRTNTPLSIVYVDVNNLKNVNDHYGHQEGDQLIKDVTDILTMSIRESDCLSRLGGDEFLLIFPKQDYDAVTQIMKRIHDNVDEFNKLKERIYEVGISTGISIYDYNMTVDEFIEIADKRMYAEKMERKKKENRNDGF